LLFAQTAHGWRPVGRVEQRGGQRILTKNVDSHIHRLRAPAGYALEEQVISDAERAGVTLVEITERDTGRILRAPLSAFRLRGVRLQRGGFAAQRVLLLGDWTPSDKSQEALF
jgi:hypothetical protein